MKKHNYSTPAEIEKIVRVEKTGHGLGAPDELELLDQLLWHSPVVGRGMFGTTYKVTLEGRGAVLAVKRMASSFRFPEEDVRRCVDAILDVQKDQHLVMPLRWHYHGDNKCLLVYDYVPTGSLAALRHGNKGGARAELSWEKWLTIMLDVARAVAAIHSAGPAACHGNIKSTNVFLTAGHEAVLLAEHGLHTLVKAIFDGASAYRAPEVRTIAFDTTQRSDVYSFGVLMLELLTGRCPADVLRQEGLGLLDWAESVVDSEDWTSKLLDAELHRQQKMPEIEMLRLVHLAMACCSDVPGERPTMSLVVRAIEKIQQ